MNQIERAIAQIHPYFENPYTPEERKIIVGKRLLEIRKHYKLTQKEVSEIIGVTAQTYSGYETGKFEPSAETLVRLAYLFNTTVDFLTARNNIPNLEESEIEDEIKNYSKENKEIVYESLQRMEIMLNSIREIIEKNEKTPGH